MNIWGSDFLRFWSRCWHGLPGHDFWSLRCTAICPKPKRQNKPHSRTFKPRANGRNIVGQQLPTLLDVTCCVRLHTLLHVVGCCCAKFETGQTFQPTTPNISFVPWSPRRSATMLDPFAKLFQHCWGRARSLRMVYKDFWVVSFPRRTAGPNIVGSCCIRLHTTANMHATTPNILGATMLGVVASVCTQP